MAKADLPFDVKLQIMKEYLRTWSTRIVAIGSKPLQYFPETNRAYFICHKVHTNAALEEGAVDYEYVGGAEPLIPRLQRYKSLRYPEGRRLDTDFPLSPNQSNSGRRFSSIFQICSFSKVFLDPLERFFFGHIIWTFTFDYEVDMISPDSYNCLPLGILQKIKHISLRSEGVPLTNTACFFRLFRQMQIFITSNGDAMKGLRVLEILPEGIEGFGWNIHSLDGLAIIEKRIRYLVTLCYQMVKKNIHLKICLRNTEVDAFWVIQEIPKETKPKYQDFKESSKTESGYDSEESFETKADYGSEDSSKEEQKEEEEEEKEDGDEEEEAEKENNQVHGFSARDIKSFVNGTSPLLSNLKCIEFAHIAKPTTNKPHPIIFREPWIFQSEILWQMVFAREWKLIWERGLEKGSAVGGYDAIYEFKDLDFTADFI